MKRSSPFFCLTIAMLLVLSGFAQSAAISTARQKLYASATDAERLASLVALGKFGNSLPGDSIRHYAQWLQKLAVQAKDNKRIALAAYGLISSDLAKGKTDSVLLKIEQSPIFNNIKKTDTGLYYKVQLLKANALNRMNNRTAALELQLQLLDEAEKEGRVNAQLFALNFIGATYLNVSRPEEAIQAWQKGIKMIAEKPDSANREIEAYILSNIALYYLNNWYGSHTAQAGDSFLLYINKAIAVSRQTESLGVLASSLNLRGSFYGMKQQSKAGEKDLIDGLAIRRKIGDPLYIVNDFIGLSNFYLSQHQYSKCIDAAKQGIVTADSNGIKGEQLQLMVIMGNVFKAQGDYKQYSSTLEQLIKAGEAHNQVNAADKIADIQTKYEVQKKETLIVQQRLNLLQRKFLLWTGGILTILLLAFLAYRFKRYQKQEKKKHAAIMEAGRVQHELAVKDAEEKERKRIAAELHDNLGVQANAILHNSNRLLMGEADDALVVARLQETAKEMLLNLRETLWAMKTADVTATDLWLRIINFMKQMGRHYTSIAFKLEGKAPDHFTIPSSQALHIVLVVQEAVNNSVKHAGASVITAASTHAPGVWEIRVKDDGKGFDVAAMPAGKERYGLSNMQQRAKEGDFTCRTESTTGKGTVTKLSIGDGSHDLLQPDAAFINTER